MSKATAKSVGTPVERAYNWVIEKIVLTILVVMVITIATTVLAVLLATEVSAWLWITVPLAAPVTVYVAVLFLAWLLKRK